MNIRTYNKYIAAISTGHITEGEIRGIKKHLTKIDYSFGRSPDQQSDHVDQMDNLQSLVEEIQPKVSRQQAIKGLAWLRNKAYTPKGKRRKHNPFSEDQLTILGDGDNFILVGFEEINTSTFRRDYFPIYRLFDTSGNSFDYTSSPWQTGLAIEISRTLINRQPIAA